MFKNREQALKTFWYKIVPSYLIALFLDSSLFFYSHPSPRATAEKLKESSPLKPAERIYQEGSGCGECNLSGNSTKRNIAVASAYGQGENKKEYPLVIIRQPRAKYTDEARKNAVSGTVLLRVEFKASDEVGEVTVLKGLSKGLTEEAVKAARHIEFAVAVSDGKAVTVTKTIEYNFSLYDTNVIATAETMDTPK